MPRYHRLPSVRKGAVRVWRWLTTPGDHHTVLGRCGCSLCDYESHVDKWVGR